jgi:hypothetical protein
LIPHRMRYCENQLSELTLILKFDIFILDFNIEI